MTRRRFVPDVVLWGLVFALFAVFAAWRSPVPGVNEPHYLCKAKHFWDPAWCARDLFLCSADAHWTFYATAGALTGVLSFEQLAWFGRLLVSGGLAFAWIRLAGSVVKHPLSVFVSACFFVALQATGNLSGEWLLGGFESKGLAYVALLLAIAAACRNSYREAGVATGVAICFHPVIGVWGLLSLLGAGVAGWCMRTIFAPLCASRDATGKEGAESLPPTARSWRAAVVPAVLCLTCSLPGLIPAVAMLTRAPTRDEQRQADRLQVFDRLNHHLDPAEFSRSAYRMYAGLLAVWLVLGLTGATTSAQQFLTRFILATLAIALAGLVIGFLWRDPGLLKFYPFRLFDLFLPMAVAMLAAGFLERMAHATGLNRGGRIASSTAGPVLAVSALAWSFAAPGRVENAAGWKRQNWDAFVDACHWIDRHVPADALCLTPKYNVGFKWYAQRAEYVTWKDCPQDAAGILEWKERLDKVVRWRSMHFDAGFSATAFAQFNDETGVEYVLSVNTDPWRREPIYRNRVFSVYALHTGARHTLPDATPAVLPGPP